MLCEKCKMREANVQYTEIVNGEKHDHYFCTECAKNMDFGQFSNIFEGEFPLAKLLSGLLQQTQGAGQQNEYAQISCPRCGTTYQDFINNSRFGCPDCYEVFDLLMGDTIKKLQGNDKHKGKIPHFHNEDIPKVVQTDLEASKPESEDKDIAKQIMNLKKQLKAAIAKEEYEEAAVLRDKIKALENAG